MTKLEIVCVIVGMIGFIAPIRIKVEPPFSFADVLGSLAFLIRYIICGLMVLLPLYFRLWRK